MSAKRQISNFSTYILECADGTYYTGIATDVEARFALHKAGKGARYTRARGVKKILYTESGLTRSEALKREAAIKRLSRDEKQVLVRSKK